MLTAAPAAVFSLRGGAGPRALQGALASTDGLRLSPSLALMGEILFPEMMGTGWERLREETPCCLHWSFLAEVFNGGEMKQNSTCWVDFDIVDSVPLSVSNCKCCFPISEIISNW